jgi:hypothetical protein
MLDFIGTIVLTTVIILNIKHSRTDLHYRLCRVWRLSLSLARG